MKIKNSRAQNSGNSQINSLIALKHNSLIKYLVQKPKFLTSQDEKILINFLLSDKLNQFYDHAVSLISSTRDVLHLYTYLMSRLEQMGIDNETLKNHACNRLFNASKIGWLGIADPEIVEYCKNTTTDKELLLEIKHAHLVPWFDEYLKYVKIEEKIMYSLDNLDKEVKKYVKFIDKLLDDNKITSELHREVMQMIDEQITIKKSYSEIGRLISRKLQQELNYHHIIPSVKITILDNFKKLKS